MRIATVENSAVRHFWRAPSSVFSARDFLGLLSQRGEYCVQINKNEFPLLRFIKYFVKPFFSNQLQLEEKEAKRDEMHSFASFNVLALGKQKQVKTNSHQVIHCPPAS